MTEQSPFRLLYLLTEPFGTGGVQSDMKSLGPHFVKNGHEVFIACPTGDQLELLQKGGVVHIPFDVHFKTPGQFQECKKRLRDLIQTIRPTVLAPQSIRSSWLCHAAAKDLPIPRITTIHNIHTPFNSLWAGFLLNKCSDAVVFESEHEHHRLTKLGLDPKKTTVIPSGIDTTTFYPIERSQALWKSIPGLSEHSVIFGCVARLSPEKAHSDLLKAFFEVRKEIPESRLILVGDGPLKDSLIHQTKSLGLEPFVHFAGQQSAIREYVSLFDVFVLASTRESLPRAAREAMACGKPIIATRVGATREVVHHGKSGLLVPPGNPAKLAKAMISLGSDPKTREDMTSLSLELIRKRFSLDIWLSENEALYKKASSGNLAGSLP
ncbi:glycosyltransferase family 4 protein [Leptospirillum ferrooxidans]|uniref:Putative glycosyl transferase, group 1 n=1 Tax=Leptospirillum ferrooxidans (strain C2-3) TaxID=1162668 RepID=I0IRM4_LEPFC|nr:glycosyltransferase family 4 protein [Leptospirillum ferrooxidans]BAM07923.1 putative glycosyl transferase, group 1 [Leptospirillum ferrooxidans C2-3]